MLPVITLTFPAYPEAQAADAVVRSQGTSAHAGTMTKWDDCNGSTGRAQSPEVLRTNSPIPT